MEEGCRNLNDNPQPSGPHHRGENFGLLYDLVLLFAQLWDVQVIAGLRACAFKKRIMR